MYENDYMYAIERSDDYLAHYGVRGMKWGVRKAIASGNSARLSRQYAKASKKLAKLEKRAAKADKYRRRAIGYGVGAAAAGGLAALGTGGAGRLVAKAGDTAASASHTIGKAMINIPGTNRVAQNLHRAGSAMMTAGGVGKGRGSIRQAGGQARRAIEQWGKSDSISRAMRRPMINGAVASNGAVSSGLNKAQGALRGVSNNTIARIGAGAIGAGLAAASAKNAYRAATAQKKAARFKSEMNKAFAGTQYANGGGNRQGGKKRKRK